MLKRLSLIGILALSLSAYDEDISDIEDNIRRYNHGISLVKYKNGNDINYYISWATSKGGTRTPSLEWTNDLYYTNAYFFPNGDYGDDNDNETLVIDRNLSQNAQNPVVTTSIYKNSNYMLSVWEDGRKNIPSTPNTSGIKRAEVRGQFFSIGENGSIDVKKEDVRIDQYHGGETHSPTVTHVEVTGTNEDLYVVAYAEDGHRHGARIKVRLYDKYGTRKGEENNKKYLSSYYNDCGWPVSTTDDKEHAFIAWTTDDSDDSVSHRMKGCVLSVDSDYDITCNGRTYIEDVKKYNHQVAYLPKLEKFFAIAKKRDENSSIAVTIKGPGDNIGSIDKRNENIEDYPIVRQAQVAVKCEEEDNICKVVYPSGDDDLGILRVTDNTISIRNDSNAHQNLWDSDVDKDFTVYKVNDDEDGKEEVDGYWPTTGIAVTYAHNWGDNDIWESDNKNKLLFLFNDVDGNLVKVPLLIDAGFNY